MIAAATSARPNPCKIILPDSMETIGPGDFAHCPFLRFIISADHPRFAVIDNALYNKAEKELLWYSSRLEAEKELVIPEGIVSIGDYALASRYPDDDVNCTVVLPSTLRTIGSYAFAKAMITIDGSFLPETATTIEAWACIKPVTDFYLHAGFTSIAPDAFTIGSTFVVEVGSYAEAWAGENRFSYTVAGQEPDLSWLGQ